MLSCAYNSALLLQVRIIVEMFGFHASSDSANDLVLLFGKSQLTLSILEGDPKALPVDGGVVGARTTRPLRLGRY